jgi:hypothetical protein
MRALDATTRDSPLAGPLVLGMARPRQRQELGYVTIGRTSAQRASRYQEPTMARPGKI